MDSMKKSLLKELGGRRKDILGEIDWKSKDLADRERRCTESTESETGYHVENLNELAAEIEKANKQIAWLEKVSGLKALNKERASIQGRIKDMSEMKASIEHKYMEEMKTETLPVRNKLKRLTKELDEINERIK